MLRNILIGLDSEAVAEQRVACKTCSCCSQRLTHGTGKHDAREDQKFPRREPKTHSQLFMTSSRLSLINQKKHTVSKSSEISCSDDDNYVVRDCFTGLLSSLKLINSPI